MTRPMSEERERLEACPCCGSDKVSSYFVTGTAFHYEVSCADCGLRIQRHASRDSKNDPWTRDPSREAEVIKLWNRRSASSAERGLREALEAIRRTPSMPFPDPGAHSWRAYAMAVYAAWSRIQSIAASALDKATKA